MTILSNNWGERPSLLTVEDTYLVTYIYLHHAIGDLLDFFFFTFTYGLYLYIRYMFCTELFILQIFYGTFIMNLSLVLACKILYYWFIVFSSAEYLLLLYCQIMEKGKQCAYLKTSPFLSCKGELTLQNACSSNSWRHFNMYMPFSNCCNC